MHYIFMELAENLTMEGGFLLGDLLFGITCTRGCFDCGDLRMA